MNFHTDEWIMERLNEHYQEALLYFPKDRIIGIFAQGSQNYGLDHADSDIDTKLIVAPTLEDIAMNKQPASTTHIRANDEHIDFKDIRLYIQTFRKQNLNFLEILFTKYKILNPLYENLWNELVKYREEITHFYPYRGIKSMQGQAKEKYFALEHHYPSRMNWINKFGYDPKQLSHLIRVEEYLDRYLSGEKYEYCLISKQPEYIVNLKNGTFEKAYDIEYVRELAKKSIDHIDEVVRQYEIEHPKAKEEIDESINVLLDNIQYQIIKRALLIELT